MDIIELEMSAILAASFNTQFPAEEEDPITSPSDIL